MEVLLYFIVSHVKSYKHLNHTSNETKDNYKSLFFFFFFFLSFRATSVAYGGSQARGRIGTVAAGLHYSHSNAGSKLCLRPTPQLIATPDP